MSIAGTWNITVASPMGPMTSVTNFELADGALTGTATDPGGAVQTVQAGTFDGEKASWKLDITTPMPMTLTFNGKVADDNLSGSVTAGVFGAFPFSGVRG
jgi:hypothetical protein